MKQVNSTADILKSYEAQLEKIQSDLQILLLDIPNIPHANAPIGSNENDNVVIKEVGTKRIFF